MRRPIRTIHGWNVFAEGGEDDMTVEYRLRWVPLVGGRIRIANGVAKDWRQMSLERFSRKYFKLRHAEWRKAHADNAQRNAADGTYPDIQ